MAASRRGAERLRRRQDFDAVMRRGRRSRHRLVGLAVRDNGLQHSRYGFAVSRRVGNAVVRNRTKRRLRVIMKALPLERGRDIVVTAQPASASASFHELSGALRSIAERAHILKGATA